MKLLIIGGGAAGCFAAWQAAARGCEVLVIERNERIGRKLRITGKGRCNLTNDCDRDTFFANIPRGARFLYSAYAACSPQDVMAYFEGLGVPLKVERGTRVFPVSDRGQEGGDALHRAMPKEGVRLVQDRALSLLIQEGRCIGVQGERGTYQGDRVLLAAGGSTYPATGSQGDGYAMAREAGHTIAPLSPSLVPLETLERDCAEMMGVSLKNVRLTLRCDGKRVYDEQGEMLMTHFGVSGPLVLSASAHMEAEGTYTLHIDLKPALSEEQLDARLLREIAAAPNKQLPGILRRLLPQSMVQPMLGRCGLPARMQGNSLTKPQRRRICETFKDFSFTVRGKRPMEEGIITRGGVLTREVDPRTMASKLVEDLSFAGEVLDLDAYTGGFNLQIAFSTAYLAAQDAAKNI